MRCCSRDKPEPKLLERAVALLREMEAAVAKGTVAQADPMAYRIVVYALGKAGQVHILEVACAEPFTTICETSCRLMRLTLC
jgi:hypothetical protein